MELKLANGDYVPDTRMGVGFETVTDLDELLQRVIFKLTVRRGSFPMIPELGSDLWLICREKKSNRLSAAYQYVSQALSDEEQVQIENVAVSETEDGLNVDVKLIYNGEEALISVEI